MREEFLAERAGHFESAIKGSPGTVMLRLTEWSTDLILEYTRLHREEFKTDTSEEHIDHFESAVVSGGYVDFYGDIPKRPLFLKMLLADVAKGDLRKRNLADLYTAYIRRKFDFDRASSTAKPVVLRPLNLDEDYEFVCARLFDVMTLAAAQMYSIEDSELRLRPRLPETVLRACAAQVPGGTLDLPSILLNSVMVPVGRRSKEQGGYIEVRFAHTSFQEFFLAQHVLGTLQEKNTDVRVLSATLSKPVLRFLDGLISGLPADEQAKLCSRYRALVGSTQTPEDRKAPGTH